MSKNKSFASFVRYFSVWLITGLRVALWPVLWTGGNRIPFSRWPETFFWCLALLFSQTWNTLTTSFLACLWLGTCIKQVSVAWTTLLVSPSINYATKGGGGVTSTTVMVFNGFRSCGSVNTKECWGRSPVMLFSHLQPSSDSCQMSGCSYPAPFVLRTSSLSISLSFPLSFTYSPCVSVAFLLHDFSLYFPFLPFPVA